MERTLSRLSRTALLGALLAPALLLPQGEARAQARPLTVAEASGFRTTSRHADVLGFIRELQRSSSRIRVESMAVSAEGRELPLIILGDPAPASPEDLRHDPRAVVYLQANIHAGEVEGKEAALMLARDILAGDTPHYLDRLVILIAPNFNPDGNERISTRNRTNQVGPVEGVGVRFNGQNLDLNRDGTKVEAPEVAGLVVNVLRRWDPILFLDSHTHNGSYHQEPVTWTWGLNPNGDPGILEYMATTMLPAITRRMKEEYGTLSLPHGDFINASDPARGWVPLGPQPRYLSNYVGLRNRFSILNEQYPYVDFETRVRGCYNLFLSFLDHFHAHRDELVAMVREADARTVARGRSPAPQDRFIVEYGREAIEGKLTILGYEMEAGEAGPGGRVRYRPTERTRTYENVPYLARYTDQRSVPLPYGYLIAVPDEAVLAKLLQHGVAVERLLEPATLQVESFRVSAVRGSERPNQGHYNTQVEGSYVSAETRFEAGTWFVPTGQALGRVASYLLEPESDDGLVVWNFFDRYLSTQFGGGGGEVPVHRLLAPTHLATVGVR